MLQLKIQNEREREGERRIILYILRKLCLFLNYLNVAIIKVPVFKGFETLNLFTSNLY